MRSSWVTALAVLIAAVVLGSVLIGLSSPDGSVGDGPPTATPTTPNPTVATTTPPRPTAARAPAAVRGTWPGRPASTTTSGSTVDWCPAVRTRGAGEAISVFGEAAVRRAACAAVSFVFDKRYSRLSLPNTSYAPRDFDFVLASLAPATVAPYRQRIANLVARPGSQAARDSLGLVLLRGDGTKSGANHASAGRGRVFYGPAFDTRGYRGRAVWINPTWSTVSIDVDRTKAQPRISARLTASAAVPVFHPAASRDDMMTIPTSAQFFLRPDGKAWRISGWTITSGRPQYGRLRLG